MRRGWVLWVLWVRPGVRAPVVHQDVTLRLVPEEGVGREGEQPVDDAGREHARGDHLPHAPRRRVPHGAEDWVHVVVAHVRRREHRDGIDEVVDLGVRRREPVDVVESVVEDAVAHDAERDGDEERGHEDGQERGELQAVHGPVRKGGCREAGAAAGGSGGGAGKRGAPRRHRGLRMGARVPSSHLRQQRGKSTKRSRRPTSNHRCVNRPLRRARSEEGQRVRPQGPFGSLSAAPPARRPRKRRGSCGDDAPEGREQAARVAARLPGENVP